MLVCSPNRLAKAKASSMDPAELQGEGINSAETASFPRAALAITATSAESMPPLNPSNALLNPHFRA